MWLISEEILDEYKEVLKRPRVCSHLIGRIVNLIQDRCEEVKVRYAVEISPDPEDDPFCLCAEQGRADFIVTLNTKDFPQDRLKSTVVSPNRFTASKANVLHNRIGRCVTAEFLLGS